MAKAESENGAARARRWIARGAAGLVAAVAAIALLAVVGSAVELATTARRDVRLGGRTLSVHVADTLARRYVGLSLRSGLADGRGMLFVYDRPRAVTFVQRGVSFAIDVVFVGTDGRVSGIGGIGGASVEAGSPGLVEAVVELPAGWCARSGVTVGAAFEDPGRP